MSRKDYVEAARILSETPMAPQTRSALVGRFVTMFADDNPRFKPSRFREACEPITKADDLLHCQHCDGTTFSADPTTALSVDCLLCGVKGLSEYDLMPGYVLPEGI